MAMKDEANDLFMHHTFIVIPRYTLYIFPFAIGHVTTGDKGWIQERKVVMAHRVLCQVFPPWVSDIVFVEVNAILKMENMASFALDIGDTQMNKQTNKKK